MKILDNLRNRHARLEDELAAEQARLLPDETRVLRLKKLKLALKDRIRAMAKDQDPSVRVSPA